MFSKILIANRGEIACRVIRTCREMRIATVAVYSDADRDALHVRMADEAYNIGPPPSSQSYLLGEKIIEVAIASSADAIHPGYGFLSENSGFVREVHKAGLVFIGPPPEAMEGMGGKMSARKIAVEAGVPIVPGTTEPISNLDGAKGIAAEVGYPVMLKASAGGGGKGMRLVEREADLSSAFEGARSEAVVRPRHIEIQVFSDTHGNHVYLGERECSIQRRHQKVIEEAPSPINSEELRRAMGESAVKVARAVGYVGAGTVEFLVSDVDRSFYFLEMNTRLQVEHPVTELITGLDLVREQILVAAGERLSFAQEDISLNGHAIECRVYAEDPDNDFMPSPGRITKLRVPQGPGVRDDSGVYQGAEVSIYYDPMISKLAVHGRTRSEAIERMSRALMEYEVLGIKTTLPFFREVMNDPEFIEGNIDTGFIPRFWQRRDAQSPDQIISDMAIMASALKRSNVRPGKAENANSNGGGASKWRASARQALLKGRL